jgi:hypothetical protein
MSRIWKIALLMILAAALLSACGRGEKPAVSTPAERVSAAVGGPTEAADVVKPVDTPAGPRVSAEGEELSVSDRQVGLENLSSYRATWKLEWKSSGSAQEEEISWEWMQEYTREPKAVHWRWESVDRAKQDAQPGAMEFWQLGNTTYIVTPESDGTKSCMSSSSEDNKVENSLMGPQNLGSVSGAKLVGTETVNGVKARHYRYDEKSIALFGGGAVRGDIWVAVDGGFVVKDSATWQGRFFGLATDDKATGSGSWTWELTDVNGAIAILAPQDCESAAAGIPILPDAREQASFGDTVTYQSATQQTDVLKFYRGEMKQLGWTEEGEGMVTDQFANLTFSRDGATASLMVSSDDNTTNIVLTVQKPE